MQGTQQNIHFSRTCRLTIAAQITFETYGTYSEVILQHSGKEYFCEYNICEKDLYQYEGLNYHT